MIEKNSLLLGALFKSSLPILFGWSYCLLKVILSNFGFHKNIHGDFLKSHQQFVAVQNDEMSSGLDLPTQLDQITIAIYSNFFVFLLTMLLIDLLLKIIQNFWKEGTRSSTRSRLASENSDAREWRLFNLISENQIKRIFCYAVIFTSLQIGELCFNLLGQNEISIHQPVLTFPSQDLTMTLMNQDDQRIPRILEEHQSDKTLQQTPSTMVPDKISLSMGTVLSSLNLNVNAMVLSRDKKIAFVTIDNYGSMKIIDISDPQSPLVLGSLNRNSLTYNFRIKKLLLSSDEKTLYTSNSRDLEIIDVSDLSSPQLISEIPSPLFLDSTSRDTSPSFQTSLAVSEKTKTLYIGGLGLQIYDISNPQKPAFLKGWKNEMAEYGRARNEICLSRDEQILFIANGTLDLYNISNPREMKLLNSFKTESSPRSLLLDEDQKTVMLLGTSKDEELIYEEVDISNLNSFKVKKTLKLDGQKSSTFSPRFLAISPSRSKLFIFAYSGFGGGHDLLVFDRIKQTTIKSGTNLIKSTFTMDFGLDGKTLITGSNYRFMTIELFFDYPNQQIFSPSQENKIGTISTSFCHNMEMSADGQYLFALCQSPENDYKDALTFWDVKNLSAPKDVYQTEDHINEIRFVNNHQTVYLRSEFSIMVFDITNRDKIELKQTYELQNQERRIKYFLPSFDGKAGFIIRKGVEEGDISFIDLTNPSGLVDITLTLDVKVDPYNSRLLLKDNGKTLIVLNSSMLIYDVSNLLEAKLIVSLPLAVNEPNPLLHFHRLSADEKILFIQTYDHNDYSKLKIYNISDVATPQLISETYFPKWSGSSGLFLSPDLKSGYVSHFDSFIKLDLTDLRQPQIAGVTPLSETEMCYVLSPNGKTIYASMVDWIGVISVDVEYTMFMKQEKFLLGKKYSDKVAMLRLNSSLSAYNLMDSESYKIIKLSFLDMKVVPGQDSLDVKTSSLPSWMSFDKESNTLTVEAKRQRDIGTYTLCSTFSLKISNETFEELGTAENPISSKDLWAWLISLDYLDPKFYLKDNFGALDDFLLPSNFSLYQEEIYNILKKSHIETCTSFEVTSSLELKKEEKNLSVSSFSTSSTKVEIKLETGHGVDARFVNRPYGSLIPVMKENKTRIALEGTIKEINAALNSIVVNYENGNYIDASVIVNDGLNPSVSVGVKNLSRYLKSNTAPSVNQKADTTVQEQINGADIQTGKYFTFTLSDDIFEDDYPESLHYEVVMAHNDTDFPSWLSFNGLTLKGTPPEEVSKRDVDLILIARNEFKETGVHFRLHISISALFWLKLLMRYSPYILTMIGLFVSANKIFNILRKDFYKHSKEFYVGVGQEISGEVIFPIMFIEEEQKQSELILKEMEGGEEEDIKVDDFIIDQERKMIDKEKIASRVQEAIQKMPADRKKQITPSTTINQIITNKFVWKQLHSKKEIKTKQLFESLRADCLQIVERDASGFRINQEKLMKCIRMLKTEGGNTRGMEEGLINQEVNIELLKDAILAFAFENHSIDISPVNIDIGVKQRVPSNFLFRFLKLDLKEIYLDYKNKMNYGINYQIIDDKLCFYGISQNYFKGKTVVVQIKTAKQRIMKEIWIHGVGERDDDSKNYLMRDEREMRGQGYEIY